MDLILIRKYLCGKNRFLPKASHTLSLLGITLGVTALLIVSSVMNGFERDMMERIVGSKAEIRIVSTDRSAITDHDRLISAIESQPGIIAASPVVSNELLAQKGRSVTAINAFGIDYDKHSELIDLSEQIRIGRPDQATLEENGIIIGLDLSLTLNATVGEYIQLSSPVNRVPTPFGMIPRMKRFRVIGIFISGMPEYDKTYTYVSLGNARYFAGYEEGVNLILVKTANPARSARYARNLQRVAGNDYIVEDWSKFDASLFQAMQLEKGVMFSVLALMLLISGFNMAGNSLKTVVEKKNEIGILKSLGMKTGRIKSFFIGINIVIGLAGIIIGGILSIVFLYLQNRYQIIQIPVPGFPMQWLPVVVKIVDFIVVPSIVLLICLSATIFALQKIKAIEPIKIIKDLE